MRIYIYICIYTDYSLLYVNTSIGIFSLILIGIARKGKGGGESKGTEKTVIN